MMPAMASSALRRAAALVVVLVISLSACGSEDPGLDPGSGTGGPAETSNTLGQCPPGGPDATTPAAGCLGPDGAVLRP